MPHRPLLHLPIAVLLAIASCSNQGEGERCDIYSGTTNTKDCKSGLVCVSHDLLLDPTQGDRCCPETVTASTDARCRRGAGLANTGGSAGMAAGGEGGEAAGTGGEAAGAGGEGAGGEAAAGSPGSGGAEAEAGAGGADTGGAGGTDTGDAGGTDSGGAGGAGP